MTLNELKYKVKCGLFIDGSLMICIRYRNKIYYCTTVNTKAFNRVRYVNEHRDKYSEKQAYKDLYNECREKNRLIKEDLKNDTIDI